MKRRLLAFLAGLALVAGVGVVHEVKSAEPASALSQLDADNLCNFFRPYGVGYVIHAYIISSTDVYCVDAHAMGQCWGYDVLWFGGWNGPYNVHNDGINCSL